MNFIFGNVIPTDELIFFRGVGQPPTSINTLCAELPWFLRLWDDFPALGMSKVTIRYLRCPEWLENPYILEVPVQK